VEVDQPGHEIHALGVELLRGPLGALRLVDRQLGVADADDLGDAVALDHHVHRTAGRRAVAVDQVDAADDEPLEGTLALATRRRRSGIGLPFGGEAPDGLRVAGRPGRSGGATRLRGEGDGDGQDRHGEDERTMQHRSAGSGAFGPGNRTTP